MRIGIDLGGTKTEVIALADDGSELFRHRLPTPKNDYQATIRTIVELGLPSADGKHFVQFTDT